MVLGSMRDYFRSLLLVIGVCPPVGRTAIFGVLFCILVFCCFGPFSTLSGVGRHSSFLVVNCAR